MLRCAALIGAHHETGRQRAEDRVVVAGHELQLATQHGGVARFFFRRLVRVGRGRQQVAHASGKHDQVPAPQMHRRLQRLATDPAFALGHQVELAEVRGRLAFEPGAAIAHVGGDLHPHAITGQYGLQHAVARLVGLRCDGGGHGPHRSPARVGAAMPRRPPSRSLRPGQLNPGPDPDARAYPWNAREWFERGATGPMRPPATTPAHLPSPSITRIHT
jgi:transposase